MVLGPWKDHKSSSYKVFWVAWKLIDNYKHIVIKIDPSVPDLWMYHSLSLFFFKEPVDSGHKNESDLFGYQFQTNYSITTLIQPVHVAKLSNDFRRPITFTSISYFVLFASQIIYVSEVLLKTEKK